MTAYIKLIDIWLIVSMIYPFSIVTLYSVIEFMKDDDIDTPVSLKEGTTGFGKKRTIAVINFMLD